MENIVNATRPHHPATRLAADVRAGGPSDHSHGSTHDHGTAAASFKALDSTDLQYPCSIVAARYLFQCYQMQTSVMLHFTNGDVGAAAKHCLGAPPRMRPMCFRSLGRDIFALAHQRTEEASRMCSLAAARYQPWCHAGLAKQFIGLTTTVEDGVAYCRVVPGEGNRLKCYEAVGEQVATLKNDPRDRAAMCEGIRQAAHRTACLYGARVQFTRPAGLPTETEN